MTKEDEKPTKKWKATRTIFWGVAAVGFGIWLAGDPDSAPVGSSTDAVTTANESAASLTPKAPSGAPDTATLTEYVAADRDTRLEWIAAAYPDLTDQAERLALYENCMGSHAFHKDAGLLFSVVVGWCEDSESMGREEWPTLFNEIDAPDLSIQAHLICKDLVKRQLKSPATADFPWLPDRQIRQPRLSYLVQSHVDAQNSYGALTRANWLCQIQYKGDGNPLATASWDVLALEISG